MAPKRAGRKHDPKSKRNQTTTGGRRGDLASPSQEILRRRMLVAGDEKVGLDFPLDVLHSLHLIAQEHRDEGLRFAMLAWSIYGFPHAGCQALYDRMVSSAAGDVMPHPEDEEADQEVWRRRQARLLQRMTAILQKVPAQFTAVRLAAQYLEVPAFLADRGSGRVSRGDAWRDMADLVDGLRRLVRARERPRSSAVGGAAPIVEPSAIATEAGRTPAARARLRDLDWARRCAPWFTGPLPAQEHIPVDGFLSSKALIRPEDWP